MRRVDRRIDYRVDQRIGLVRAPLRSDGGGVAPAISATLDYFRRSAPQRTLAGVGVRGLDYFRRAEPLRGVR